MNKRLLLLFTVLFGAFAASAQTGSGSLKGKLTDESTGEALPFVNIILLKNGTQAGGSATDFDGNYSIKPIQPGSYDIKVSSVGYNPQQIQGVSINANKTTFLNIKLTSGVDLEAVEIVKYSIPIIDKDNTVSGETVDRKQIAAIPGRSATAIATTSAGVSTEGTGGGVSIRGARTDGDFVYIDGVKVRGADNLPKSAIQQVSVITGGLPANYGDATGGIISITTRGPSAQYFGGFEALTSGFRTSETEVKGLDNFGRSILEASLSGPLLFKKKADGTNDRPILGFFMSANYTRTEDAARSIIGHNVLKPGARAALIADPLSRSQNGTGDGVIFNSSFARAEDFENVPTSRNTGLTQLNLAGKVDVTTSPTVNLSIGGRLAYQKNTPYDFNGSFFNASQNRLSTDLDYSFNARFSQRFENSQEEKSTVKNAYYSILVDYSKVLRRDEHEQHKDNYFDYGYVGKFEVLKDSNQFELVRRNGNAEYYRQTDLPGDTLVIFTPGTKNPLLANYTSAYFDLFDEVEGNYDRIDNITNRGLRNGDAPASIYNIFEDIGTPTTFFQKQDNTQFRISASGSADIGDNAVQLGFEYEQRVDRAYTLNNLVGNQNARGTNIWAVMRNLTNFHLKNLDRSDSTIEFRDEAFPYVTFDTNVDTESQRTFDRNLREKLGLDPFGDEILNIDAIDPSVYSIDLFSAEDLLNNGNRLANYFGFDPYGNKTKGNITLNDYFTERNADGDLTRPIGAFEPIYFAGYVLDKFEFDDLVFNVGLRVDRFDANQEVLKDKYILADAFRAGDLANAGGTLQEDYENRPSNIGDDFAVYVDDLKNPKNVVGYRDGDTFYDSRGNVVNPKSGSISASNGELAPYLKDADNDDIDINSFEDYTPQVNIMPRVSFSFPISDVALFFAHYDILTRRPFTSNRLDIVRYQFIRNIGSSANNPIQNPNLLPEKTIDYEIGFQQKITNSSGLKISAFYREMRDQIQVFQNVGAYPQDYFSFDNLDFGTVKGLTIGYDLRRTGNIYMRLNYTLQFADGTGSSAGGAVVNLNNIDEFSTLRTISPLNFDQRHRINANIDYHYGSGKDYNGPVVGESKIFENAGANLVFNVGSGTPYSASSDSRQRRLDGTINGSRLPWRVTIDGQIDKTFTINYGKDNKKSLGLNAYLLVNNILNAQNILNVYPNTGNPEDDGYLTDPDYQAQIGQSIDEQSFRELYALSINRNNYSAPRTIQIGVRLDF